MTAGLSSITGHFTVYAVLALLLWWTMEPLDLSTRRRFAMVLAGAVVYGLSDEWHQSFVSGRDPSLLDLVVDGVGACCGLTLERASGRSVPGRDRGG